jgi:hypothetical protein
MLMCNGLRGVRDDADLDGDDSFYNGDFNECASTNACAPLGSLSSARCPLQGCKHAYPSHQTRRASAG